RLGGWYDYRGVLGAQVALLAPAAAAFALKDKDNAVRACAGVIVLIALCVTLAAGGFLGACAGIIAVAGACIVRGDKRHLRAGLAALLTLWVLVGAILPRLPRQNTAVLLRGVALFADVDADGNKKPTARLRN